MTAIGSKAEISAVAQGLGRDISAYPHVETDRPGAAAQRAVAQRAVALCRDGTCEALMKGALHTDQLLHPVLAHETGLRAGRRLSHVFAMNVSTYPKKLYVTDMAINIYPDLDTKVDILNNAVELVQAMGVETPKVAILSAVETVTPKIESTLHAAALCKMADRGQINGAILDGPLAFDNAISAEAAAIKHITSPVAGDADILLCPDLESANMLAKQLQYLANAKAAGLVLGARVPIILTSRADLPETRLASAALCALFAAARRDRLPAIRA